MIEALLPFLDKKVGVLSAPAARALKESVDPPPFKIEGRRKVTLGEKKAAPNESDSVPHLITSNVQGVPGETVGGAAKDSRWARLLMAVCAVVLLAVFVGLVFAFSDRSEQGKILAEPALASTPFPTREKNGPDKKHPAELESKVPEKVTIQLRGLPEDAEVLLDEKALVPPIELLKSDRIRRLNVNAPGYRLFSQEVIPDANKTLKISMKRKKRHSVRSSTTGKKKRQPDETQDKRGEVWTRNPFVK
jgi:hypothetical protein